MDSRIKKLLKNQGENYIFPFFWQHGEDEATLRKYMQVIDESNIKEVCVENRPHPDFCGPKWWEDMDVIFDEAKKRNMRVWILDDSHFSTGYANGAMNNQPLSKHRQSICCRTYECTGESNFMLGEEELLHAEEFQPSPMESMIEQMSGNKVWSARGFDDDQLLGIYGGKETC